MKDMVSNARTSRQRPKWISETIWKTMVDYWDTEPAKEKTRIYSTARMSDRDGLGPHIHLSGPTSYQQIQYQMEEELGRPVSLGEVFIKTHTKPDGTYVDQKAKKIVEDYQKNLHEKLAEIGGETSMVSDGTSRVHELTPEDYTAIFLKSTQKDSRGNLYGVGSIKDNLATTSTGKNNEAGASSSFVALEEQLKQAQQKIEEQAVQHARVLAEQKQKLDQLSMVEKYLRLTDPGFLDFMEKQSSDRATESISPELPQTSTPALPRDDGPSPPF